jgi:hypothetical protein
VLIRVRALARKVPAVWNQLRANCAASMHCFRCPHLGHVTRKHICPAVNSAFGHSMRLPSAAVWEFISTSTRLPHELQVSVIGICQLISSYQLDINRQAVRQYFIVSVKGRIFGPLRRNASLNRRSGKIGYFRRRLR